MRVCHKSVTHLFFFVTLTINEFFDMQNLGVFFSRIIK